MASTERSLGWATSGTGDGPAAGYNADRWTNNARKTDGSGITLFGSLLAMSGTTTSTLTIADGAALINGYTYESNGAVTISTTGLTGTYNVILVANTSAGTVAVTANGAGTTTIAASTVRIAVATAAQTSTITTTVGGANVITLGTITTTAGTINTITPVYPYSTALQMPSQFYGAMYTTGVASITNALSTTVLYSTAATSGDNVITANAATGEFTVNLTGIYHVDARVLWDSNTAGIRHISVGGSGFTYGAIDAQYSSLLATNFTYGLAQQISGVIALNAGAVIRVAAYQTSGGTRTITDGIFKIVRA